MSKRIRHISSLKKESGLTMTSRNDPSCPDPLRPSDRARRVILPLICMVSLLMWPLPVGSAGPANESVALKVRVVDAAGREPIAGAEISARFLGDFQGADRIQLSTAADGCCDVSILQPQPLYVSVYVQADGYVPVKAQWSNTDDPSVHEVVPQSFEFPLEKGTSIGGIVKNKKDEPIAGAKVSISLRGREGRIRYYVEHSVKTGADGKWRSDTMPRKLDGLFMGIEHPEYVPTDMWISSAPHLKHKLRDFSAVTILDDGVTVTGLVYDHQGEPIEKALLMTGRSGYFSRIARTDRHGRFEFKHCKFEPLYLSAQAPGKSPAVRRLRVYGSLLNGTKAIGTS